MLLTRVGYNDPFDNDMIEYDSFLVSVQNDLDWSLISGLWSIFMILFVSMLLRVSEDVRSVSIFPSTVPALISILIDLL